MNKKILIVNGYSDLWKYIPMGTFGLCDFLCQQGIESKIFNAAIYNKNEYLVNLKHVIDEYKPDYIGIVIHWKELLENCISLSYEIKSLFPRIKIVAGGMTAGFLDEELLRRFESIDFVIKGDPEKPLSMLINNNVAAHIPNLAYRQDGRIIKSSNIYTVDKKTLNSISFTKLGFLIDHEEYITQVNNVLGFPIFIGRGCIYDCLHCGGSRKAFQAHSDRQSAIRRDIPYVIRDLKRLLAYTDNIYIDYEVSLKYIYDLFTAVLADNTITKKYRLNYCAWHLMDYKLVDLYSRAFKFDAREKSIIGISPETSLNKDRKIIRVKPLYFSNKQMHQAIKLIQQKLGRAVVIQIFYSRYYSTQNNKKKLMLELENIHRFRERLYISGEDNLAIMYNHLATDVGSFYWDLAFKHYKRPSRVGLLLSFIRKSKPSYPNNLIMDNLCIYSPGQLSEDAKFKHETLIACIDLMLREAPGYYFNLTKALGFSRFTVLLEGVASKRISLNNINIAYLIDALHSGLKNKYKSHYNKNPVFFEELFVLYMKCLRIKRINVNDKQKCFIEKPILDNNKFYVSSYNFIHRKFYRSLSKGINNIKINKTLNIFCLNRIYIFEYKYFKIFKLFNGKRPVKDILKKIAEYDFSSRDEFIRLFSFISSYRYWFTI